MSHAAVNWALKQRGLSPAGKIVLFQLCDRYHPDHGCFPSQETLAYDCEMSRSSLNAQLKTLEARGLIARERQVDPDTRRQARTRYRLACEDDFELQGRVQNLDTEPCPESGESRVQNLDRIPVREPVRLEKERARARVGADGEKKGQGERSADAEPVVKPDQTPAPGGRRAELIAAFRAGWPTTALDNQARTTRALEPLSDEELDTAVRRIDDFVALCREKGRATCAGYTYLEERRWRLLARGALKGRASAGHLVFACWSREWCAFLIGAAARRDSLGFCLAHAAKPGRNVWSARPGELPPVDEIAAMVRVETAGPEWGRWAVWLEARGVNIASITWPDWIWVPPGAPPNEPAASPAAGRRVDARSSGGLSDAEIESFVGS